MENSCLKRAFFNAGLAGALLFLQGCSDSPDCASKSATNALVEYFKSNPQNGLFESIPLHIPLILNYAARRGADTLTDQLCADYKRLCAMAAERNHIIGEISERQSGGGKVNNCHERSDFLKQLASEMDRDLSVSERKALEWLNQQEQQYQAWKAGGYQSPMGTPEEQHYEGGVTPAPSSRRRSDGGGSMKQTTNVEEPDKTAHVVRNNENGCLDVNQLSRKADILSVYLEHDATQARVSDIQKHDKALSKGSYDFDNIVMEGKNAETGAVACRADIKLGVKGWGEAQGKVSYRVEKASSGKIIVTPTGLD